MCLLETFSRETVLARRHRLKTPLCLTSSTYRYRNRKEPAVSTLTRMLSTHPARSADVAAELIACIEACTECQQTCAVCADACLSEEMVTDLTTCIRTNLDCADICAATASLLTRKPGTISVLRAALEACRAACAACAEECEKHADMHEHCRVCADACRRCEKACTDLLELI